jgi:hypothetical protein
MVVTVIDLASASQAWPPRKNGVSSISSPRIRALNASHVPFCCRLEASGNLAVSASPG